MTDGSAESALIVEVPAAESLVARWREAHDPMAALGVPAHVTILYPFVQPERLTAARLAAVAEVAAAHRPFRTRFVRVAAFPTAIYLDPEPDEPFRALTAAFEARFPDHPPYGGRFDDVVPHLTIAMGEPSELDGLADRIAADLGPRLPLEVRVADLGLLVSAETSWSRRATFRLGRG